MTTSALRGVVTAPKPPPFGDEPTRGTPALAWLTAAAITATAVPAFVRLPYDVPGLQSLTPQKILLPMVVLSLAFSLWRRPAGRVLTPLVCTAGGLFLWLLASVLVNRQYQFVYNLRAWSWLALDFGLLVAVKEVATRPSSRRLVGGPILAAVVVVALAGFFELLNLPGTDRFFYLFRPNWINLGLSGPGPEVVLPVHGFAGPQMLLWSTLSNDAGWFLALGSVVFAGAWLFGDLRQPWANRLAPAGIATGCLVVLLALLLTLSRSSILMASVGLAALLGAASVFWPHLRRRALVIALASLSIIGVQTFSNSILRTKFVALTSTDAWTAGMTASTPTQRRTIDMAQPHARAAATERKSGAQVVGAWSVTQRVIMARVAFAMVSQNPVFGVGFTNFRTRLYEPGRYAAIFEVGDTVADVQDPHDFFLWIATAGGLPALLLVLLILGLSARTIVRAVARGGEDAAWAVTTGAAWLTLAGFMFMGFTLMTPASQVVFALLVGATAAIETQHAPMELPAR